LKSPHDTSVDGRRESQVIRVDNQLFQGAKTVPLGFRVASSSKRNQFPNHLKDHVRDWPEWRCRDFWENNLRQIERS
jgi:hypothetical protein